MIVQWFPNPRKKVTVFDSPKKESKSSYDYDTPLKDAVSKGITIAEWWRRDILIRNLVKNITFRKGDIVYPHNEASYELYGACRVVGIVSGYSDFTEKDWPKDDYPFIIQVISLRNGAGTINATANYFSTKPPISV